MMDLMHRMLDEDVMTNLITPLARMMLPNGVILGYLPRPLNSFAFHPFVDKPKKCICGERSWVGCCDHDIFRYCPRCGIRSDAFDYSVREALRASTLSWNALVDELAEEKRDDH